MTSQLFRSQTDVPRRILRSPVLLSVARSCLDHELREIEEFCTLGCHLIDTCWLVLDCCTGLASLQPTVHPLDDLYLLYWSFFMRHRTKPSLALLSKTTWLCYSGTRSLSDAPQANNELPHSESWSQTGSQHLQSMTAVALPQTELSNTCEQICLENAPFTARYRCSDATCATPLSDRGHEDSANPL